MARLYIRTKSGQQIGLNDETAAIHRKAVAALGFAPTFPTRGVWNVFLTKVQQEGLEKCKGWIRSIGVEVPPEPATQ